MKRVLLVGHPGALGMELLGVHDLLQCANDIARRADSPDPYRIELATLDGADITLWPGGLRLGPARNLRTTRVEIDTLVVVGGPAAHEVAGDGAFVAAVRRASDRARRTVSICTGSFILAGAGLLDGRCATTHWTMTEELARKHPEVEVDPDRIFVQDGNVWTSAGATTGFDLLLSLIESDLGPKTARTIAQIFVLYLRRTGNQTQFSTQMTAQLPARPSMRELAQYISEHPADDLSLAALAARMTMSPRHFARVFTAEFGLSPGRYVEKVRVETARRLLESDCPDLATAARAAGYGNAQAMRRAFTAALGVSPTEYRRRFGSTPTTLHLAV